MKMQTVLKVLGSGSTGNAALLKHEGFGLLLDCGLGPQVLSERLQVVGETWESVNLVVLTHTHSDHWNKFTFEHFRRLNITVLAHEQHHTMLASCRMYEPLHRAGLTARFADDKPLSLNAALTLRVVKVPHDSDPTYALRFDCRAGWSLGWATDLGMVPERVFDLLHGVDVLGLEFNHDIKLERASRRPRHLVERVLGDDGHLSNFQAALALRALVEADDTDGLQAVVQLHLSRECNTDDLAAAAAQQVLRACQSNAIVVTAKPFEPVQTIVIQPRSQPKRLNAPPPRLRRSTQLPLPGFHAT